MGRFGFVFGPDGAGPYSALNNEGICRDALRRVRIHGGLIEPALPEICILNAQSWQGPTYRRAEHAGIQSARRRQPLLFRHFGKVALSLE